MGDSARLFRVLRSTVVVAAILALARGDGAIFSPADVVVVPSAFGHLAFAISKEDVRDRFEGTATAMLDLYNRVSPCRGQGCPFPFSSAFYAAQIRDLAAAVKSISDEVCSVLFGDGERSIRLVAERLVNSGRLVRADEHVVLFETILASEERRTASLIYLSEAGARTRPDTLVNLVNRTSTFEKAFAESRLLDVYTAFSKALRSVLADARMMYDAAQLLDQGIVSPLLINPAALAEAYQKFQTMSAEKGLRTIPDDVAEALFDRPYSAHWAEGDILLLAVAVPLIQDNSQLLRAFHLEEGEFSEIVNIVNGREVVFRSKHKYIAVRPDNASYLALTQEDWDGCLPTTNVRICGETLLVLSSRNVQRWRFDSFEATCIGALYAADSKAQENLCWGWADQKEMFVHLEDMRDILKGQAWDRFIKVLNILCCLLTVVFFIWVMVKG